MSGVNKVILVGHVGKDPEVRYFDSGNANAKFSLATSETYKDKSGQKVDSTEWHNVVVWGKLAEIVEKYVRKGKLLYIEGRIKTRSYDQDNQKKYITEIVADQMTMLGGSGKSEGGSNEYSQGSSMRMAETTPLPSATSEPTDDLPF